MNILLSLDPGVTTGYCLARMNIDTCELAYNEAKLSPADLLVMLQDLEPAVIVYEDFQYRNRQRAGLRLDSVELIGIVKAYGTLAPSCFIRKQQPAEGKAHYNDEMLRKLGLYQRGTVHGRDACRHLLHYMAFGPGWKLWPNGDVKFKMVSYATFGA
jgi:hypothetical protein